MTAPIGKNPNVYAQEYATKNKISLEEAKNQLKAKYGEPTKEGNEVSLFSYNNQPNNQAVSSNQGTSISGLIDSGWSDNNTEVNNTSFQEILQTLLDKIQKLLESITTTVDSMKNEETEEVKPEKPDKSIDKETYAQQYATEHGLSLDEAKAELREKFGDKEDDEEERTDDIDGSEKDFDPGVDPETYAQQYATEQGITVDEAKAELKAKYGAPDEVFAGTAEDDDFSFEEDEEDIDDMPDPGINPDTYAQQYATKHGITLDEAKAELKAKYGDPQKPEKESGSVQRGQASKSQRSIPKFGYIGQRTYSQQPIRNYDYNNPFKQYLF
ncbi:hypothetical protein IJ182_06025 [bacterium]|nr:hypothetical protein [bacterium]